MASALDWDLADGVNSPSPRSWNNQKKKIVDMNFRVLKHSQFRRYPQNICPLLTVPNSVRIGPPQTKHTRQKSSKEPHFF